MTPHSGVILSEKAQGAKSIYETWGFSPLVELGSEEQDPDLKAALFFKK